MSSEMKKGAGGENMIENLNEEFDTFEAWVMDNWRIIAAACVAIVALVAAAGAAMAFHKASERKTGQQFASASSMESLQAVLKAHPGSSMAPDARMRLAMLQMEKKDYPAAIASFKEIASSPKASDALKFRASLNTGYALELQGNADKAIAAFTAVGQSVSPEDIRFEANYCAGRLLAGKSEVEKAKSLLSKATSVRPRSMGEFFWSSQAKALLDRLQASAPASGAASKPKG